MQQFESLTPRVTDDVARGKELHANEQTPTFLYEDVDVLEKLWDECRAEVSDKNEHYQVDTGGVWCRK